MITIDEASIKGGQLEWPEYNGTKPVTTGTARQILEAVLQEAAVEYPTDVESALTLLSKLTANNKIWRKQYDEIYIRIVELQQKVSIATLHKMVQAAINKAHELFVYRNSDDETKVSSSLSEAASTLKTIEYTNPHTSTTNDDNVVRTFPLASPIDNSTPSLLRGNDAIVQVECWRDYGCLEKSAADHAIATLSAAPEPSMSDAPKNLYCILGITSELAPSKILLQHVPNSHVIGISRNPSNIVDWYKELASNGQAAFGTKLHVAAADFLKQFPVIGQWIVDTVIKVSSSTQYNRLVLLPMGYMDGEANVRLCLAMDLICTYVIHKLGSSLSTLPITVGYWISPSTVYSIPKQCVTDAVQRYETNESSYFNSQKLLSLLSLGKFLQPSSVVQDALNEKNESTIPKANDDGIVFNGVMKLQGPNYLLAKMLQQWRCIDLLLQQQDQTIGGGNGNNVTVLAPHAPPSRTVSVTHSAEAFAAIEGMPYIAPPLITFSAPTCSTLMTAIMLHQLKTLDESSQQQNYQHPHQLFWDGSVHGGIWTCPYDGNSLGIPSYILGKLLINTKQHGSYPAAALATRSKSENEENDKTSNNVASAEV